MKNYKINVDEDVKNELIMYETIFADKNRNFSIKDIKDELNTKGIDLSKGEIQLYVDQLVKDGLVKLGSPKYVITI